MSDDLRRRRDSSRLGRFAPGAPRTSRGAGAVWPFFFLPLAGSFSFLRPGGTYCPPLPLPFPLPLPPPSPPRPAYGSLSRMPIAPAASTTPPDETLPSSAMTRRPPRTIASRTAAAFMLGRSVFSSPAMPATAGVAADVPVTARYSPFRPVVKM